jgi:mannose-6-phosphate isomerase-like protein (cupin superfamily)
VVRERSLSTIPPRRVAVEKSVLSDGAYRDRTGDLRLAKPERSETAEEQLTYILEGKLRFFLGDDESEIIDVAAGEVLHLPSNLPHKAEALEDTVDVDVFSPPRQDWLDGTDAYLR